MRREERELQRIPGVVSLEMTNGDHIRLTLENERMFFAQVRRATRAIRGIRLQIRKELR
jgi:hypothetical protein